MLEGQTLSSGAELRTRSGSHRLVMQTDGNLVVRRSDNSVQWQTGTSTPGSTLLLRDDGVLVVRTPGGATSWSSSTLGFGTERLVLDADGTVRVWTGFWTATRRLTSLVTVWSSTATGPTDRLPRGRLLGPGASIVSPDRSYTATMQTDGNLVFRRGSLVVWHSGTRDASRTAYARFNADGNLTVTGQDDRLLFSAQMGGRGGVATVAKSDGTLQIVTASGAAIWSNGVVVK